MQFNILIYLLYQYLRDISKCAIRRWTPKLFKPQRKSAYLASVRDAVYSNHNMSGIFDESRIRKYSAIFLYKNKFTLQQNVCKFKLTDYNLSIT